VGFVAAVTLLFAAEASPALAVDQVHDEIQVYNAEITVSDNGAMSSI